MATKHNPSVRIRMYRQGLGDCFLLTFTEKGKDEFNMMIDCGLLQGTTNGKEIMGKVAADIESTLAVEKTVKGEKKKWLDVVVLTHEHADHISGFTQAKDVFEQIHFGEVWAAWLDDEHHPKYKAVRERFKKQITGLKAALAKMDSSQQQDLKEAVQFLLDDFFDETLLGASGNGRSPAWDFALTKSVADPRFFTPGTMFSLAGFGDIRVYILGPSEDFESFTKVNPPEDDTYRSEGTSFALMDSFFAAVADDSDLLSAESFQPFEKRLRIDPADAAKSDFFKTHYGFLPDEKDSWRRIDHDWLSVAGNLALNLDTYTNNTCLAFAIEFVSSKKVLLFPGDAQFSNWLSWQKLTWEVPDGEGKETLTAKQLLERTVFYKVGHHGSHNATLKKHGLEMMTNSKLAAMIPVDREKAKAQKSKTNPNGWEMPEANLFNRLLERTRGRIILADEGGDEELKVRCTDKKFISKVKFLGSFVRDETHSEAEPLCVELTIKA